MIKELNTHYSFTNPASVHDEEALTALELAGRTTAKVNEVVKSQNDLNETMERVREVVIPETIRKDILEHIEKGTFDDQIDEHTAELLTQIADTEKELSDAYEELEASLGSRLDNLLGKVVQGSTSMDSEIIDARVGYDNTTYANLGAAIRSQIKAADLIKKQASTTTDANGKRLYTDDYNNFDNVPANSYITYVYNLDNVINHPYVYGLPNTTAGSTGSLLSISNRAGKDVEYGGASIQIYFDRNSNIFYRFNWSSKWQAWQSFDKFQTYLLSSSSSGSNPAPFDDADTLPPNSFVIYSFVHNTINLPVNEAGAIISISRDGVPAKSNGNMQIYISPMGHLYTRLFWSSRWLSWQRVLNEGDLTAINAKIDNLTAQVELAEASVSLFEHVGVIGDSYASGHLYYNSGGSIGEFSSVSWNQIMARRNGISVVPFAKGGLSTRTWLTDSNGLAKLQSSEAQQLYILCLGINDRGKLGESYLGTIADIKSDYTQNADTFYGNYGKIIESIKVKAPNAKIIMSAMHDNTDSSYKLFNAAIEEIAQHYQIPVIRQYEDAFFHTDTYTNKNGGHPTAVAHSGMAIAMERLIGKCLASNKNYFGEYTG